MAAVTPIPGNPIDPADRINGLIDEICRMLTKHGPGRFIDPPMLLLIWNRIMRLARRFASLAERVRTGRLAATARGREASVAPAGAARKPRVPPGELPPTHFRWLVNMLPEAEPFGGDLCWILQLLEMREFIFKAPRQAGRILRPLCRMLGVEPTSTLRLPARARVPSVVVAPEAEAVSAPPVEVGPAAVGTPSQSGGPPSDGQHWGEPPWGFPSLPPGPDAEVLEFDLKMRA